MTKLQCMQSILLSVSIFSLLSILNYQQQATEETDEIWSE